MGMPKEDERWMPMADANLSQSQSLPPGSCTDFWMQYEQNFSSEDQHSTVRMLSDN